MNISLIGMMGSGKTTIAKSLSLKLKDFSLVDIDELITIEEKCTINDIFKNKGESYFRQIESRILSDILKNQNQIIATGGGIVLSDVNIKNLKDKSIVFFLNADADIIFNRIKNSKTRPLLNDCDMNEKIRKILEERIERYNQAHYIIDTNNKEPEDIVDEIIRKSGINGNG